LKHDFILFGWNRHRFEIPYSPNGNDTKPSLMIHSVQLWFKNLSEYTFQIIGNYNILQLLGKSFSAIHNNSTDSGVLLRSGTVDGNSILPLSEKEFHSFFPSEKFPKTMFSNSFPKNLQNHGSYGLFTMRIAPHSQYIGYPDGFQNDNFMNFSVHLNETERWDYYNMDHKFFHPKHFHLTSGYVVPSSSLPCVTPLDLYPKDIYFIGPQQLISFYLTFIHYSSENGRIPHLGYMYHCHYMGHHDMNMMGQFYVYPPLSLLN